MSDWTIGDDFLDLNKLESEINDFLDRSHIEENIKAQLAELEMLQSVFCKRGELILDDPSVLADLEEYSEGKSSTLPLQLDYTINLDVDNLKIQITVNLPLEYPTIEPDVFARSDKFTRSQQHDLNVGLSRYLTTLPGGEIAIYSIISWLQDNVTSYVSRKEILPVAEEISKCDVKDDGLFTRLWIYSHHIYSKNKRRELLEMAQELELTGFLFPGRPGIICFEGWDSLCRACLTRVKGMNWKKIALVKTESEESVGKSLKTFQHFNQFEELAFEKAQRGREFHMDFGKLNQYLIEHGCGEMFKVFFGVHGKTASASSS